MAQEKQEKKEKKEELTREELKLLINVLAVTPTQNLQVAQQLINLSNKITRLIDER
jgi:hypothetical protein